MQKRWMVWAILATALPGVAAAQQEVPPDQASPPTVRRSYSRPGPELSATAEAGVATFVGDAADVTRPGATYGVNVGLGIIDPLSVELGYQGALYDAEPQVQGERARISENGGQFLVELGPRLFDRALRPYALGGVAVSRLSVVDNEASALGVVNDDTLVRVPVGAGIDYVFDASERNGVTLGARGTYRFEVAGDAFPALSATDERAQQITGQLVLGGRF